MAKEKAILICVMCRGGPPSVEGSIKENCTKCGTEIWTSPATRKQAESDGRDVDFVCVRCAIKVLVSGDHKLELPDEDSLLEISGALNKMSGNVH